jgi:LPXTG-motif cell wall-anchored protein
VHNHTIYIGYLSAIPDANNFLTETFHVAVSTDGAKTFKTYEVAKGPPYNFTKLWIDTKGNLYAVWTDQDSQDTFLATSKATAGKNRENPGSVWRGPYRINTAPAGMTIFPDVRAGSPGRMAAIYYGTDVKAADPDSVKPGEGGWWPYVSVSLDALCGWKADPCASPTFHQMRVAHKINHDDNICTSGTACAATGGNRNMADYWDIDLDRQGHLGFVWDDTTNGLAGPVVKVARQASGPSLYRGKPKARRSMRHNGVADPRGDARFPISGANIKTADNHPTLDLRGTSVHLKGDRLQFVVRLKSTADLGAGVPTGNDGLTPLQQAKYVVRWDFGGQVYYAGANVAAGAGEKPTFFAGEVSEAEGITSPTNPDNLSGFGNSYAALTDATGKVDQGRLVINVPASAVGHPKLGSRLFSVGSYAMVGGPDAGVTLETLPITVDAAPTFDTKLTPPSHRSAETEAAPPPLTGTGGGGVGDRPSPGSALPETGMSAGLSLAGAALLLAALLMRRRRAESS